MEEPLVAISSQLTAERSARFDGTRLRRVSSMLRSLRLPSLDLFDLRSK
jgi:hypothetical protein